MGLRDLRRHCGLPRLLLAQAPADLADWLDFVALGGLLVFHWGVGPVALAWLAVALGAPYVLVGPFMGALVDRVPLRAALVLSNLGRALATLALDQLHNVAVQGRHSRDILAKVFWTPPERPTIEELPWFRLTVARIGDVRSTAVVISRTGYSGELGYEGSRGDLCRIVR